MQSDSLWSDLARRLAAENEELREWIALLEAEYSDAELAVLYVRHRSRRPQTAQDRSA